MYWIKPLIYYGKSESETPKNPDMTGDVLVHSLDGNRSYIDENSCFFSKYDFST